MPPRLKEYRIPGAFVPFEMARAGKRRNTHPTPTDLSKRFGLPMGVVVDLVSGVVPFANDEGDLCFRYAGAAIDPVFLREFGRETLATGV